MRWLAALLIAGFTALAATPSPAHEVRPAYLEIRETGEAVYDLLWKVPARGEATLPLDVVLPGGCARSAPEVRHDGSAAQVRRWSVACESGLAGREVRVEGLDRTLVETIVRFESAGGLSQTARLTAAAPALTIAEPSTLAGVAAVYLPLGIDHILLGFDHLCFVLALLLLIGDLRRLVAAITAFTAAHSVTLAAATLGYVSVPSGPVEALIAFSIALVAAEGIAARRGRLSPTAERPWLVAFAFGLLHGLGFAGALSETGLPDDAIPLALLFFNIGVEVGQLVFVGVVVLVASAAGRWSPVAARQASLGAAYAIGTLAAFWTIDRVVGVVA